LEPSGPHLTYLTVPIFLLTDALFSLFIRNRLHLSEPPLATISGIVFGPKCAGVLRPEQWGFTDDVIQEITRLTVGIQCFAVGLELPNDYFRNTWRSLTILLGPVMAFGWVVCAAFVYWIFETDIPTALIISACLTPTDPVLAASVLSNSQFSERVPLRLRLILSAESGCNDGVSFLLLCVGISILTSATLGSIFKIFKKWFLVHILYQCGVGIILGLFLGHAANRLFRFSNNRKIVCRASYLVFYLLLAIFSIGAASTLGVNDFLVAFGAGVGFGHAGNSPIREKNLPVVIDLLLNSTFLVFFGALIPWHAFTSGSDFVGITPGRLIGLIGLVLVFRRLPIVLALYRWMPAIKTFNEALFTGHFGPMGVGALFLVMEARAQLETDASIPLPHPPHNFPETKKRAVLLVWPVVCAVVLASTMVHGLSTLAISIVGHLARDEGERAPLIGAETDGLGGMVHEDSEEEVDERYENGSV
ncbi:Na/H antiporter-like protein, partial [Mytilinidion resinicola]